MKQFYKNCLLDSQLSTQWFALDMERNLLFENYAYSGATTDLQNLFAHSDFVDLVFKNSEICKEFVLFLSSMEGNFILGIWL